MCRILFIVKSTVLNLIFISSVLTNNISVNNVSLSNYDMEKAEIFIQFDISWENSWRLDDVVEPFNWDAAWIFAKFKIDNGPYQHVWLSPYDVDHVPPPGAAINVGTTEIDSVNKGMGVFLYRSENNKTSKYNPQSVYFQNVQLKWLYEENSVDPHDSITVSIFVVEMVYIPQGGFYAGDGISEGAFSNEDSDAPVFISAEGVIIKEKDEIQRSDNLLYETGVYIKGDEGINTGGAEPEIDNEGYPTGYRPFYIMKYSLTVGQYADFLNTLTPEQAANRWDIGMGISNDNGTFIANAPYRGIRNQSWNDVGTYADWAGLRPMSELEFEKTARGPLDPVPGEYVWGTNTIALPKYVLENPGQYNERIVEGYSNTDGNAHYWSSIYADSSWYSLPNGPIRVGIFAKESYDGPASPRVQSGAAYYGVMDLTGNLRERVITISNSSGRNFRGIHGDGRITESGLYDVASWPSTGGASGNGLRGGDYRNVHGMLKISERPLAAYNSNNRQTTYGFRAVRSAPAAD